MDRENLLNPISDAELERRWKAARAIMAAQNIDARPLMRQDEPTTIEPGMNLAVHPTMSSPSVFMIVCDNLLIGADGKPEALNHFPQQIFEM